VDYVLHQAALPSVPRSIASPVTTSEVNINGTLNMLLASKDARVKKFVYASSSSIYGDSDVLPKVETLPNKPLSPYAVAKLSGEEYCKVFSKVYGLQTVILRYFNVFGPYQDPTSEYSAVIPKFINLMLDNKRPEIHGDGEQSRDFTYIDNVVSANIKAATEKFDSGMVMNCACNESITLNRLFEIIKKELKSDISPIFVDSRVGDVKHSLADISKIQNLTGYKPVVKFEEGIKKTIEYYRKIKT
jgi:nucleoside-diphosphate-sugar epimerase